MSSRNSSESNITAPRQRLSVIDMEGEAPQPPPTKPVAVHGKRLSEISGFELFPPIRVPEKAKVKEVSPLSSISSRSADPFREGSSAQSDDVSTLESSILNRILDEEERHGPPDEARFYYGEMYDKYKARNRSGGSESAEKEEESDFDKYNHMLSKEERIRGKLAQMRVERQAQGGHVNYLKTLDIGELDETYVRPTTTVADIALARRARSRKWYNRLFKREAVPRPYYNGASEHYYKEHKSSSSISTAIIDDDAGFSETPVELQAYRGSTGRKKLRGLMGAEIRVQNSQNGSVDMVVSNIENVDYNLQPIDDVIDEEGDEDGWYGIDRNGGAKNGGSALPPNAGLFRRLCYRFNPVRIAREQRAKHYQIQRKLRLRHLHQIALGGTLGVGLLLSSGKSFSIAGPLGCFLGFVIAGLIVLATMLSFCEIVTLIPLCGGVSGVSARFVDDAFGFAMGVGYWLNYAVSMPTEITAATIMLSFYPDLKIPGPNTAVWITLFLAFAVLMNLFDVRLYGEIEYFSTVIKVLFILMMIVYMIVLNVGKSGPLYHRIGFRYWDVNKSDLDHLITYGPFRPTFDVLDTGLGSLKGVGGAKGRFCQVMVAVAVAAYAYVGTEVVIIAGGEARNPRRSIPSATRNIYWRILIFYILAIFVVSLNIYSGDPRLLRYFSAGANSAEYADTAAREAEVVQLVGGGLCKTNMFNWAGFSNGNQSPFVIAIQSAGLCNFSAVANAFLLYFAVTAATSQLYASSRTLYFMSLQGKAPKVFSICSKSGVPYFSVLFTALFGAFAYLAVDTDSATLFEVLLSICTSSGLLVWAGMCLSFVRFYYAMQLRPDIIARDDPNYPYRSPFQPYTAYFGMVMAILTVITSGFLVFIRGPWSPMHFISCYGSLFLVFLCYVIYKVVRRTKVNRIDQMDLDSGRREIDRIIWEDEGNYVSNFKETFRKIVNFVL